MSMWMTFSERLNVKLPRIRGEQLIMMIHIKPTPHLCVLGVIPMNFYLKILHLFIFPLERAQSMPYESIKVTSYSAGIPTTSRRCSIWNLVKISCRIIIIYQQLLWFLQRNLKTYERFCSRVRLEPHAVTSHLDCFIGHALSTFKRKFEVEDLTPRTNTWGFDWTWIIITSFSSFFKFSTIIFFNRLTLTINWFRSLQDLDFQTRFSLFSWDIGKTWNF